MIIWMNESRYEIFIEYMKSIDVIHRNNIAYNLKCYDKFMVFPDEAPQELIDIINKAFL